MLHVRQGDIIKRHDSTPNTSARTVLIVALALAWIIQAMPASAQSTVSSETAPNEAVTGPCGSVMEWAVKINEALERGDDGYYNKMTADIEGCDYRAVQRQGHDSPTEKYWCTNLVIDAYNLAGITGLNVDAGPGVVSGSLPPPGHQQVITMANWWMTAPGYIYIDVRGGDRPAAMQNVRPGYAIFYESVFGEENGREHVALVSSISVDSKGNGEIATIDSNAESTEFTYRVVKGTVKDTPYPVIGFGGH
jgi:hypothetical protein